MGQRSVCDGVSDSDRGVHRHGCGLLVHLLARAKQNTTTRPYEPADRFVGFLVPY
jgi:hypothetical protein